MMLNRIKIVTSLMIALGLLGALQLFSSGLFFNVLNHDQDNLAHLQRISEKQETLNKTWSAMLQTRNSLNRAALRHMLDMNNMGAGATVPELLNVAETTLKQANGLWSTHRSIEIDPRTNRTVITQLERDFDSYYNALEELIKLLAAGDLDGALDQPTQRLQDQLEESYNQYLHENGRIHQLVNQDSASSMSMAKWTLAGVLLGIMLIFSLVWYGIRQILLKPLHSLLESIRLIARGDLVCKIDVQGSNEIGELASTLRDMQAELARTVGEVRIGADAIYTGAMEISVGNNDLSARTEQQAASLEQTAASMEELTATVKQNAENAQQASHLALSASETAGRGGKVVENVVTTMTEIAGSSQKIADITSVIDGIAFQTNILALNAAVEAARAGEQGRGFAVVASEVRSLAQRSAQAAKEIKILIDESVNKVSTGSTLVESAGETMNEIVGAVTRVTDIMSEIASASEEQSRGIEQVSVAVAEMDRVTQQNTSLVEESATAAAALEEQASRLNQAVAVFHIHHTHETPTLKTPQVRHHAEKKAVAPQPAPKPAEVKKDDIDGWETF